MFDVLSRIKITNAWKRFEYEQKLLELQFLRQNVVNILSENIQCWFLNFLSGSGEEEVCQESSKWRSIVSVYGKAVTFCMHVIPLTIETLP